jgi:short-subunit dehydrogenase
MTLRADLTGRTIVVTGASSGLGHHFVGVLADNGAMVVLGARRTDRLHERVQEIENAGGHPGRQGPARPRG